MRLRVAAVLERALEGLAMGLQQVGSEMFSTGWLWNFCGLCHLLVPLRLLKGAGFWSLE